LWLKSLLFFYLLTKGRERGKERACGARDLFSETDVADKVDGKRLSKKEEKKI